MLLKKCKPHHSLEAVSLSVELTRDPSQSSLLCVSAAVFGVPLVLRAVLESQWGKSQKKNRVKNTVY